MRDRRGSLSCGDLRPVAPVTGACTDVGGLNTARMDRGRAAGTGGAGLALEQAMLTQSPVR